MKFYTSTLFVLLCIILSTSYVAADTPANCSYSGYIGTWLMQVGPAGNDRTLNCSVFQPINTVEIVLSPLNVAKDEFGNVGNWTLIYNQGVEIWLNDQIWFAYSSWNATASLCSITNNGWVHDMDGSNWACYNARFESASQQELSSELMQAREQQQVDRDTERLFKQARAYDPQRRAQMYRHNMEYIAAINEAQDMWVAKPHPMWEGMSIGELERRMGHYFGSPLEEVRKEFNMKPAKNSINSNKQLPTNFDWRNVNGVNYVSPVRNQGNCGSCYSFSSCGMLEARFRVWSNNTLTPIFSPQNIVSCSNYSQGCEGGFPYLIAGKYARDFGMVQEACYPYNGQDSQCLPDPTPECDPTRWYSREYYYVGGFYGESTEEKMMEEIMANGPISVSFEVYPDFMNYAGGVYTHQFTRSKSIVDDFNPFELTNHAVLAVGWGVTDQGVKYWIVKNSWGTSWGENGFFRILRGSSEAGGECAIESLSVSAIPDLTDHIKF